MKPSNTSNEPQRITETPASPEENLAEQCARISDKFKHAAEADRLRAFLKDCDCRCCRARARLQYINGTLQTAASAEEARLRALRSECGCPCCKARSYLCGCPCCEIGARLRAISYARTCESSAATSDRGDYPSDPATLVRGSDEERRAAEAYRIACESRRHPCEIVRAAAQRRYETDTDAR